MAGADYKHCDKCYRKVFYDANVDYENYAEILAEHKALCRECAKTHTLALVERNRTEG